MPWQRLPDETGPRAGPQQELHVLTCERCKHMDWFLVGYGPDHQLHRQCLHCSALLCMHTGGCYEPAPQWTLPTEDAIDMSEPHENGRDGDQCH